MSLIEQALRRIQEPLISKVESPPPSQTTRQSQQKQLTMAHPWTVTSKDPPPNISLAARPGQTFKVVATTVMALTVLSVVVISGVFWMRRTFSISNGSQIAASHRMPSTQIVGGSPQVSLPSTAQGDLVLSGIVEGLGEPYAVINGMILVVGDQIGNARLVEIGRGMARLRDADGSDTILRAPR